MVGVVIASVAKQSPARRCGIPLVISHMGKQYCVYVMANKHNTVLYTGVTSDLKKRVYQHREKLVGGFTNFYNVTKLFFMKLQTMFMPPLPARSRSRRVPGRGKLILLTP
jgi:putative endonuclease